MGDSYYRDPTTDEAIARADRKPDEVRWLRKTFHDLASLLDYDVRMNATFTDRKTKREWDVRI